MIFTAGISIAFFISALLLVKKEKSRSDWILLCWTLLNAAHLSLFYLLFTEKIYDYPFLLGLQFPIPLMHGVMLFLYVSSVTNVFPKKKYLALLHFIPSLITIIYLIPFILSPTEYKINVFKNEGQGYEVFQSIVIMCVFLSGVIYVFLSSRLLHKHKQKIRNQFSDIEERNLRWLQFLTYGLGIVWFLVIITQNDILIFTAVSIFVILIGFFGFQQKEIFKSDTNAEIVDSTDALGPIHDHGLNEELTEPENAVNAQVIIDKASEKEKYLSSGLSDEKAIQLHEKLKFAMSDHKLYKNSDLSLSQLADELDAHPNYISQILNEKEKLSFYDYINTYRVNEFKRLITIPSNQNLTLLAVAYDCGFNSKSSFNRYFKKVTDQTPSQFVKTLKSRA